jgi:hypothetical protein
MLDLEFISEQVSKYEKDIKEGLRYDEPYNTLIIQMKLLREAYLEHQKYTQRLESYIAKQVINS